MPIDLGDELSWPEDRGTPPRGHRGEVDIVGDHQQRPHLDHQVQHPVVLEVFAVPDRGWRVDDITTGMGAIKPGP
jgi:hypothetical protein